MVMVLEVLREADLLSKVGMVLSVVVVVVVVMKVVVADLILPAVAEVPVIFVQTVPRLSFKMAVVVQVGKSKVEMAG